MMLNDFKWWIKVMIDSWVCFSVLKFEKMVYLFFVFFCVKIKDNF